MDRKFSLAIATLMLAVVSACDRDAAVPASGRTAAPATTAVPAAVASPADQAQVQALAFIVAFDEQQMAAAEQARGKKIEPRIRAYADLLHAEHSANLDRTHALADAARLALKDDADVLAFRSRGESDLERMAALEDEEYAQAYLAAMADGHAEVLALIDQRLLAAAIRPELRQHLTAARAQLEQQLQSAKALQSEIPAIAKPRPKARPAPAAEPAAPSPPTPPATEESGAAPAELPTPELPVSHPPDPTPATESDASAAGG